MTTAAIIELAQVVVRIGERTVLDAIDLTIAPGERVAIVGHNGAGKSTLLRVMTGMVQPAHGSVTVLGHSLHPGPPSVALSSLRAQIGQVFQALHLVQRLSTLENVLVGSLARHRSLLSWARIFPAAEITRAEAALHAVGLIGKADLRADRLSGGERQKVAIARMLLQAPRLVIADEPTAALDPVAAGSIAALLADYGRREGVTLVTVVHDPGLLPIVADRVVGLRRGRIVFDLPVANVDDRCLNRLYRDPHEAEEWVARCELDAPGACAPSSVL